MSEERQFRTVQEIMEHYYPEQEPKTGEQLGEELAECLLTEFRAAMKRRRYRHEAI